MYLSSLFLTLALSLTSTVVVVRGNPAPSANGNSLSHLLLAPRADCGPINGNCYDNGCDGDKSSDGLHCISGEYAGCPCGYGCNKNYVGPCEAFGCDGVNNVTDSVGNAESLLLFKTIAVLSEGTDEPTRIKTKFTLNRNHPDSEIGEVEKYVDEGRPGEGACTRRGWE
ncbi:hypothetical protein F5890DRAFT_1584732 [Lentinula detonsa]|uniref:Uncharacterized protein n=1 Tax=Lentinula detonsa TaxID=2804962 RepID=A0AA38Q2Z8_9AGAR|nr:hypothetical protein F5890DRAFT_1584732 [Lentinula detonsa]